MSSESSSDEDDVPLSTLAKKSSPRKGSRTRTSRQKANSYKEPSEEEEEEEEEFEDDDDDDDGDSSDDDNDNDSDTEEDDSSDGDGDDDDDGALEEDSDTPLSKLRSPKKRKAPATKKAPTKKKKTATAISIPTQKKTTKKKKTSSTKKKKTDTKSSSVLITAASELYAKSKKGKLISELLCRWWYVMTWPDPASVTDDTPPNCDVLDGFPGVFITTSGDDTGKIMDMRDDSTCPNFINMAKKSSEELKELLLKAVQEQTRVLIEAEGEGTQTEKDLKTLEKWAGKVNAKTADKEAEKILKAAKLKIK